MTRVQTFALCLSAALPALLVAMPLAAQQQPDSYTLPEAVPTPTPAPAGPADERAGVVIPPRAAATPAPTPAPAPGPSPSLSPLQLPQPQSGASPAAPDPSAPAPQATPQAESPAEPAQAAAAEPDEPAAEPGFSAMEQPANPAPQAAAPDSTPSDPLGARVFDWAWLAAAAALLAGLVGALALWRRRKPKVLRLAPPLPTRTDSDQPALPRLDLALDITGATRSLMMFTLQYRLNLANRTDRAVSDLAVAVHMASAQRGAGNAAPPAAARSLARVERIGPHQSRSVTGEVQLPVAAITPMMQGRTALFIPLVHVTLEGEGQQVLARSFVVGTPGGAEGRVRPLPMDLPPGSISGLKARAIAAPAD